jgi:hypothetical protein
MNSRGLHLDDPAVNATFYEHLRKHGNPIKYDLHSLTSRQLKKQFSRNLLLQVHVSLENGATIPINISVLHECDPVPCSNSEITLESYTVIQQRKNTAEPMLWPTAGTDITGTNPWSPNPLERANISANENLECSCPPSLKPVTRPCFEPYKLSPLLRTLIPS